MSGLLLAWGVEAGVVTWRAFKRDARPPLPSELVATFVIFGALGIAAEAPQLRTPAAVMGWGIVIATALNLGPATHLSPQGAELDANGKPTKVTPLKIVPTKAA